MLRAILNVSPQDHKRVAGVLFQYLFHSFNKYEYRRQIGDRVLAKEVWDRVSSNGYVLRECKLFAYAVHWNRQHGLSTSPASYGIDAEDVSLLRGLDLSHLDLKYKPYTLFNYQVLEEALITSMELSTNIGKFVSKKLIFLDRHFAVKRDDIEGALIESSLYALRKQFPIFHSDLHALNICKTAARNKGWGLVEYYTRGKRIRLMKENNEFQAVNVPLDSVEAVGVMPEHENETRINLQALVALEPKMAPAVKAFLHAAAGQYDSGFTMYLGIDNTEAASEWEYGRYMAQLRLYLHLSEQQVDRLLLKLRHAMS